MSTAFLHIKFLFADFFDAMFADVFAFEFDDAVGAAAENTSGLVFFEHNGVFVNINFKGVFFFDVEGSSKFDGQDDSSKLIDFSNNAG